MLINGIPTKLYCYVEINEMMRYPLVKYHVLMGFLLAVENG